MNKDFLEYVKNERENFAKAMSELWLAHNPQERVAIENLLIAYDQMKDKLESSQPSLPLDWEKEFDTAFCNEIIESNGTEGGLRDNELQMFWEGAEFLRNKAKEWFKTHLLSKVSYGSGMSEEEASEPITTALYNSGIHDTEGCSQLAENILKVIGDYGYKIVKAKSSATPSDEDKAMRALESLTPGGSEFVGDVDACVKFIKEERESLKHFIAQQKSKL